MKFFILAIIIIGILAVAFYSFMSVQIKISNHPITTQAAPSPTSTPKGVTSTFTPPVFIGPTAQPHIKGPTANPPNY